MLAHEQAHLLRHHHHHRRHVRTADACAAALPFLRPAARRVRYLTERWADESAARSLGSVVQIHHLGAFLTHICPG